MSIDQRTIESLVFYSQFTQVINPVNLTKTRSINLAQVSSYECAEVVEDDSDEPQKKNQKPKIVPIVVMQNGNELELSPEENKIFRVAWNAYTEAAANALQILQAILTVQSAQPAQPAQAAQQLPQ